MRGFQLILFLMPVCAYTQAPPRFTIQDLGSLPGNPVCAGMAISQSGLAAGYCTSSAGAFMMGAPTRGFLYTNGAIKDLGPAAKPIVVPSAVNDSGIVVGTFLAGSMQQFFTGPFIYQNGSIQRLTGASPDYVPFAITNTGQIAGTEVSSKEDLFSSYFYGHAMVMPSPGSSPVSLQAVGTTQAVALGISPDGNWIAGASASQDGAIVNPTLWHAQAPQALPSVSRFQLAAATAVNDSGTAAGFGFNMNYLLDRDTKARAHAAVFASNGAVTDLGTLMSDITSYAVGINNAGWVIGFSTFAIPEVYLHLAAMITPPSFMYHAFLYADGKMYDLSRTLINGDGWQLSFPMGINNTGQIVGTGEYQGQQRAFLLTPVEPPKIGSVAGGGLSVPGVSTLSPNSIFTIFGTKFAAAGTSRNVSGADLVENALPSKLADTCVQAGTDRWGLLYVSPTQINALAGPLPASGTVPVSVITNCGKPDEWATSPVDVPVAAVATEFLYFKQNPDGHNPIAAVNGVTGANIGPTDLIPGVTFVPARANDVLTAYGVAWGETDPPLKIGALAAGAAEIISSYSLTVGGIPAQIQYIGVTPTYSGLYQVNFVVPPGLAPGNQPVLLTVNGIASPAGAYLTIGQ